MVDGFIRELSTTYGLGEHADDFLSSLGSHVRFGEGGLDGFVDRIRVAGFEGSFEHWMAGDTDHAVSGALVGNLLGTGYLQTLAKSYGLSQEAITRAAGYALPKLIPVLESAQEAAPPPETNALQTTEKPNWLWGLIATALLAGTIYWVAGCNRADYLAPKAEAPKVLSETVVNTDLTKENPLREAEFELSPTADGYLYSGIVSPSMVAPMTSLMESNLGQESIRGGLVGAETQMAPWSETIGMILTLISAEKSPVGLSAKGNQVRFFGVVPDRAAFESKVRAAMTNPDLTLEFSELK